MYPYFYYFYYDNYMRGPTPPPMPPFMASPNSFPPTGGPPSIPPPNITPTKPSKSGPNVKAIDSSSIKFCRYKFTYIWPSRGKPFWMWIVYVGRKSISGWKWTGYNWIYAGIDLNRIDSFQCY